MEISMKPDFETMTNAELRSYALAHREEIDPLRILFQRRTPDTEATLFHPPKTAEEWQQQIEMLRPILEKDGE
jgi:hypothetical protein